MEGNHKLDVATRILYNALTSLTHHPEPTKPMQSRHMITRLDEETGRIVGIFYNNEMTDVKQKWRYIAIEALMPNLAPM